MCIVHQPVQDCVSQGVVADTVVPLIGRQLAEHCGGTAAISIIHDFHEVVSMRLTQWLHSPVVENQQLDIAQGAQRLGIAAIGFGLCQFQQQARHFGIAH